MTANPDTTPLQHTLETQGNGNGTQELRTQFLKQIIPIQLQRLQHTVETQGSGKVNTQSRDVEWNTGHRIQFLEQFFSI